MPGDRKMADELAALTGLVDTYGGDRRRWPDGAAERFAPLLAANARARRLLDEAGALDMLLATAPQVGSGRAGVLADRIAATAEQTSRGEPRSNVVPFDLARRKPGLPAPRMQRADWRTAAMLAASLAVGIFAGASGLLGGAMAGLGELAGLTSDTDGYALAINQAMDESGDEDIL